MNTKTIIFITISLLMCLSSAHAQKKVMFDLSHGQCQGSAYTADILPDYQKMAQKQQTLPTQIQQIHNTLTFSK